MTDTDKSPLQEMNAGIAWGWKTVTSNLAFFAGLMIVLFILEIVASTLASAIPTEFVRLIWTILIDIAGVIVGVELILLSLRFYDGEKITFSTYKPAFLTFTNEYQAMVLRYIGVSIMYSIMVFIGFILLIIPGILLALTFCMSPFLVIDKKMGMMESLKLSADMTKGYKLSMFVIWLEAIVINIIGLVCLGLGLLVTLPLTLLAYVFIYRYLLKEHDAAVQPEQPVQEAVAAQ